MEDNEFERLERKLVYKGKIIDFYEDTVKIPNGNIAKWDFIGHKGAAAGLPVLKDGRILMVKQYRNALDRYTLEIPAGGRDSLDEDYAVCAARELKEETGFKCDVNDLTFLIRIRTTVAFCNERIDVFIARNLDHAGSQHLDEDEFINVIPCTREELTEKIYSGQIEDGKTISSLMAYFNGLDTGRF